MTLPADAAALPVEAHLARLHRPVAVASIVENGLVRPLDPAVKHFGSAVPAEVVTIEERAQRLAEKKAARKA